MRILTWMESLGVVVVVCAFSGVVNMNFTFSLVVLISVCVFSVQGFAPKSSSRSLSRLSVSRMESSHVPRSIQQQDRISTRKAAGVLSSAMLGLFGVQKVANAAKMRDGEYLKEPTAAFKEEMANTKAMNARQTKEREKWDTLFTKFENSKTTDELEASLKALIVYLKSLDGVPTGFSKAELVKRCRARRNDESKKRRKPVPKEEWTTPVEIQYQALIQSWNKAMTPENMADKMSF